MSFHNIELTKDKSLHELIEDIVTNRPCKRFVMLTYSISEQSLRVLDELRASGKIEHLVLILDKSVVANKYSLLVYAENIADEIYTIENHAKLVLFDDSFLMSSANFNRIKRIEMYAHMDDVATVAYLEQEIAEIITQAERIR